MLNLPAKKSASLSIQDINKYKSMIQNHPNKVRRTNHSWIKAGKENFSCLDPEFKHD